VAWCFPVNVAVVLGNYEKMSKSNTVMSELYDKRPSKNSLNVPPEMTIGNRVAWKITPQKGRGIFAIAGIAKGEIIEQSPVTIVPKAETDFIDEAKTGMVSVIDMYLLRWKPEVKGQEYCLGHGFLMLYNHHPQPNGDLQYDFDMRTISMVATRDIKVGEEITFDYDCELWFDFKG
jgi:SET domain-containing protein